jgi:hypothetical protein
LNPSDLTAKNILGKDLSAKLVGDLAKSSGQIVLVNSAKHVASQFPRTATTVAIPAVAEAASGALGVGIESISMGYDIYKKRKEHKAGKISTLKFKKYLAR